MDYEPLPIEQEGTGDPSLLQPTEQTPPGVVRSPERLLPPTPRGGGGGERSLTEARILEQSCLLTPLPQRDASVTNESSKTQRSATKESILRSYKRGRGNRHNLCWKVRRDTISSADCREQIFCQMDANVDSIVCVREKTRP